MAAFRFRAAAALDLRRRQESEAATALARAEAAFAAVKASLDAAIAGRDKAKAAAHAAAQAGIDADTYLWHRNWIGRLSLGVDRLRADLERHAVSVRQAERAWQLARRRKRVLERLRDRALTRHRAEQDRIERIDIDELARLRYVMPEPGTWREET